MYTEKNMKYLWAQWGSNHVGYDGSTSPWETESQET